MTSIRALLHDAVDELDEEQVRQTLNFVRRLKSRGTSEDQEAWRRAVEAVIADVQSRSSRFSSEEIEQDITLAAQEVREARRARCGHG